MENNNGRGIFYGVMGVATLVVAIVGATFAYFAASTSGTANAVAANSVTVAGTLALEENTDGIRNRLIPTANAEMLKAVALKGTNQCTGVSAADGKSKYDLCSTYVYTLTNNADVAQTVYMNFTTVDNGFENLYYCVYEATGDKATGYTVNTSSPVQTCGAVPAKANAVEGKSGTVQIGTTGVPIDSKVSKSYAVVLYINETSNEQPNDEGKKFVGTVSATTSSKDSQVTGVVVSGD